MVKKRKLGEMIADPFGEWPPTAHLEERQLLGAKFRFECSHRDLRDLVRHAYARLPKHRLWRVTPRLHLQLKLVSATKSWSGEPPPLQMFGGAGLLGGAIDSSNIAALCIDAGCGVVNFSRRLLEFPYHARYELLEFAVFTFATRSLGLVPLHAACIGANGRGLLLMGESGAGKSTLALQCLLHNLEFLSEDATFIAADTLLATGVANFLHVRDDSLRFIDDPATRDRIRQAPTIRRRSGVEKYEVDLRRGFRLAPTPLQICGSVFLSKHVASGALLQPISTKELERRLQEDQPYAATLPTWRRFIRNLSKKPSYILHRGLHPSAAAHELRTLLNQ